MHHGDVSPEIARGLLALDARIAAAKIPSSKLDETINVAVWNIREFGKARRTLPAVHYIAEILGQFDLIAIVELRNNLEDLGRVLPFLGPSWDVIYSDWIDDPGANNERVAFLFDRARRHVQRPGRGGGCPSQQASEGIPGHPVVLARPLHVLLSIGELRLHRHRHARAMGRQCRGPQGGAFSCSPTGSIPASRISYSRGHRPDRDGRFQRPEDRRLAVQGAHQPRSSGA